MKRIYYLSVLLVVLGISSCATIKSVPRDNSIINLLELVNTGDAAALSSVTNIPLLVDGEIVMRSADSSEFWESVTHSGFTLDSSRDFTSNPVTPDTYKRFADTMEVRTFFKKYVPSTAVTVEVSGSGGEWMFLLSGRSGKYPYILGFTGPYND